MSSSMDVDPPTADVERNVEFHALAIVHMSDQYTRISCGGSPLSTDASVVGLLFGTASKNGATIQVMDADDVPTEISEATKQQIELHQAVFPQHAVVGWYRVSVDNQPTANDVQLTRTLREHFAPDGGRFLFSLLQVKSDSEDLPLSLYELNTTSPSPGASSAPVLIGIENWQLETSEPERIAVERVVREQTTRSAAGSQQESEEQASAYSSFGTQVSSIVQSFLVMNDRLMVLIDYLEKTEQGLIPPNPRLLRQVKALVCQLGPLIMAKPDATFGENSAAPMLLSHMAVVAKTVSAIKSYTDKFRSVYEANNAARPAREPRRF